MVGFLLFGRSMKAPVGDKREPERGEVCNVRTGERTQMKTKQWADILARTVIV